MLHDLDTRKFLFRLLYVLLPAIAVGSLLCFVHPYFGVLAFLVVAGLGWDVTEPHLERGDS